MVFDFPLYILKKDFKNFKVIVFSFYILEKIKTIYMFGHCFSYIKKKKKRILYLLPAYS